MSGMTASAWPRAMGRSAGGDPAAIGVEHGGRAGFERGVDGEDAHGSGDEGWIRRRSIANGE
jgi:hypothetical protein